MPAVEPSASARRRQHLIRRFRLRLRNDRTRAGRVLPRTVRVGGRGPGGGVLLAPTLYRSGGCLSGRAVQVFAHCCSPIFVDVVASRLRCCSTRLGWWEIPGHWARYASATRLGPICCTVRLREPFSRGWAGHPLHSVLVTLLMCCGADPDPAVELLQANPGCQQVLYRAGWIVSGRGQRGRDSRRSVAAPGNGDRGRAGPA